MPPMQSPPWYGGLRHDARARLAECSAEESGLPQIAELSIEGDVIDTERNRREPS